MEHMLSGEDAQLVEGLRAAPLTSVVRNGARGNQPWRAGVNALAVPSVP